MHNAALDPMMSWLPPATDFRAGLRVALDTAKPTDRIRHLASLAGYRLGFLETIQLDRAFQDQRVTEAADFATIRLAVLASSTVDHLLPAIRIAGLRRHLLIETYSGAYGQYRQDLLEPTSRLHQFAPQAVLFSLTVREAIPGIPLTASAAEVDNILARYVDDLRLLWRKARSSFNAMVVQQTFLDVTEPLFGNYDRFVPGSPARIALRLNDLLCEAATQDRILLLDVARACARDGLAAWFDAGRWFHAKLEIAPRATPKYGDLVARILAAQRGMSKKCLVLDLDNTLWGGVIGDDGVEGIVLGSGSAAGEAHVALQRYAKQLK